MITGRGLERETEIEECRRQHGRCVAKFKGIDTISEAEKYIGSEVRIVANDLPATKEGWFYTFQLKGCEVYGSDGRLVGTVADVVEAGGSDILSIDCAGKEVLIPFADEYVKAIDPDRRRIDVELPEELRNLNK